MFALQQERGTHDITSSWSPDGAHITASNATNNEGYVFIAAVIARNTWTSEITRVPEKPSPRPSSFAIPIRSVLERYHDLDLRVLARADLGKAGSYSSSFPNVSHASPSPRKRGK